jgi:2-phospho-L-lactate guanylyltransferase
MMRTGAVVALKTLARAKSRFGDLPPALRQQLVWVMAQDTLGAVSAAVDHTILVTAESSAPTRLAEAGLSVEVLPDPAIINDPLNAAFASGVSRLAEQGCTLVACVMADVPTLTPMIMTQVLSAAADRDQPIFVRDASGIGTTMLVGRPAVLVPRFGEASAQRHLDHGALDLVSLLDHPEELDRARADVDDHGALERARELGLQPKTARLVADAAIPAGDRPGSMLSCG